MDGEQQTFKVNSDYNYTVPAQVELITDQGEIFNADEMKKYAQSLDTVFESFANVLAQVNELVNSEVNASCDKCVYGAYGANLLNLWNNNASTFSDFKKNFTSWSQAVAVISNSNLNAQTIAEAIYANRTTGMDLMTADGTQSVADKREDILLASANQTTLSNGDTTYSYFDTDGKLVTDYKDGSGNVYRTDEYDEEGNLSQTVSYDEDGNYAVITYSMVGGVLTPYVKGFYDSEGNRIEQPDTFNEDGYLNSDVTKDAVADPYEGTNTETEGEDAEGEGEDVEGEGEDAEGEGAEGEDAEGGDADDGETTTAADANLDGKTAVVGTIPEDATVIAADDLGEGYQVVTWNKENGETCAAVVDGDGNVLYGIKNPAGNEIDLTSGDLSGLEIYDNSTGNPVNADDFISSVNGTVDGNNGDVNLDDIYYDDTFEEGTVDNTSVTLKSGDSVSVNGTNYNVYGFTKTQDGRVITMYADKEGYLFYQDSSGNIQPVMETFKQYGGGNTVNDVSQPATISSVDNSHTQKVYGNYTSTYQSSLQIGDTTVATSSDIIGTATFENGSLSDSVTVNDTSGSAYTGINVGNSTTTDGTVLQSYNGNINSVVNGDTIVTATGMSDFTDYVKNNPDANIVIKIPQDQYVQWDSPDGGTGYEFNTDKSAVYLKWNSEANGYQIVDEYGNVTNDRVFTLDGFNDNGGASGGVWK